MLSALAIYLPLPTRPMLLHTLLLRRLAAPGDPGMQRMHPINLPLPCLLRLCLLLLGGCEC